MPLRAGVVSEPTVDSVGKIVGDDTEVVRAVGVGVSDKVTFGELDFLRPNSELPDQREGRETLSLRECLLLLLLLALLALLPGLSL